MSTASHTAATPPAVKRRPGANGHPCHDGCGWSSKPSSQCECICAGARHGMYRATDAQAAMARARISARIAATGDVLLGGGADLGTDEAF